MNESEISISEGAAQIAEINPDDYSEQNHDSANSSKHNIIFAAWLVHTFGVNTLRSGVVLDIGGGKGILAFEMTVRYGIEASVIDTRMPAAHLNGLLNRKMKKIHKARKKGIDTASESRDPLMTFVKMNIDLQRDDCTLLPRVCDCVNSNTGMSPLPFDYIQASFPCSRTDGLTRECSVLCGMHSDQCTEAIIDSAIEQRKPFAVVPCCIFRDLYPKYLSDGTFVDTYPLFLTYLRSKHPGMRLGKLPFFGRNVVLYMTPDDWLLG